MRLAHPLIWATAVAGGVAAVAWWALPAPVTAPAAVVLTAPPAPDKAKGWSLLSLGGGDAPAKPANTPMAKTLAAPEDLWQRVFVDGSLRGAELDGGWGLWDGKYLTPSRELRRRFDQLLTTVGETEPEELRALVAWLAERDLGSQGAQEVLAVWDRYLKLQHHAFNEPMDLTRPERWGRVLQEHQLARRDALGPAWADAFYRDEETAFRQRIDQGPTGRTPEPEWTAAPPAGVSPEAWQQQRAAALGQEAAARLAAEEQAQAQWQQRLNEARQAVERLSTAPELSAVQRQEAAQTWLNEHFQGTDRLRASALLGL